MGVEAAKEKLEFLPEGIRLATALERIKISGDS